MAARIERTWETPSHDDIVRISRAHVEVMERSDDEQVWVLMGMPHLLLRTIGRRTGREHKVALPYWVDPDGHRVVVASFGGHPRHPSWYLNLTDRRANPEVWVRVRDHAYWSVPELFADGPERDRLWAALLEERPFYAEYQAATPRTIPLVRLPETRPA